MKKLLLLLSLIIFACQSPTKISEKEVMNSFNSFFEVLDNDLDNFESMVTEDFFIFENSRRYSKEEFIEFVKTFDIVSSKRSFEDVVIDEVNELLSKDYDHNMPIMKAIGVREISSFLNKEIDREDCKNIIKKNTRNYIKRQITWIKGNNITQNIDKKKFM